MREAPGGRPEGKAERERFILSNMALVHALAHRLKGRGIEYEELVSAGCVGLLKAADGFEPERGLKFSTYAVPVILGEMKRLFRDSGSVKVSRSLKELSLKALREKDRPVPLYGHAGKRRAPFPGPDGPFGRARAACVRQGRRASMAASQGMPV